MTNQEWKSELPDNYDELKKAVNRTTSWRERLAAVEELGQWKNKQIIDLLTLRMANDPVYKVQEAAFRKLRAFGESVQMPAKDTTEVYKGMTKILVRIKKSLPVNHSYEEFKEKLKKMRIDLYDSYEGDKGDDFDKWLEPVWESLRR